MQNLAIFLTRLQSFNLHIITKAELKRPIKEDGDKLAREANTLQELATNSLHHTQITRLEAGSSGNPRHT